jgi:pimeloyl-ACP methyl ester carboxylesterase
VNDVQRHDLVAADGVRLSLYRVGAAPPGSGRSPVLLVPGTFSTRLLWLGTRGQGLAWTLWQAGFDPWVLEQRGHGRSEKPRRWTMSDWIRLDAPAAVEAVLAHTGAPRVHWVGHSAGGVVGAGLLGHRPAMARRLAGLAMLGAPGPGTVTGLRRWGARGAHLAAALLPRARMSGRALGLGPEQEPSALVREWMGWNARGAWRDAGGRDYLVGLPEVRLPVFAVAGAGDRWLAPPHAVADLLGRFGSPDRTLLVAGRRTGFSEDFDHPGLMVSRAARREIWPRLVAWLRERTPAAAPPTHPNTRC